VEQRVNVAFEAAVEVACHVAARTQVTAAWDNPSVLQGYTVGEIVAHVGAGLRLFEHALGAPPDPSWRTVPLVDFYGANRVEDPSTLQDPFHVAIHDHAARAAAKGPAGCVARLRAVADRLVAVVDALDGDRPVPVWRVDGGATAAVDYLRTRVVELVVHADDLAASVGLDLVLPATAVDVATEVLVELARARSGDSAVVRAFTRAERVDADVLRVL
jgi:uncharacterized protein (TIGR03083 family)